MSQYKEVFTITKDGDKTFFNKLGVAFRNKDGSLNVKLFGLPVNGELHIRDPKAT